MCGYGKSNDDKLEIYLGWYGAYLRLNNEHYNPFENRFVQNNIDKTEIINKIKQQYTYEEFIKAILESIENGEEG